ncbi:MAG TPA: uroporphyrinogen decarboxylase [Terriglobia bacterium]|nr:uroporphyrinogen decarboxylase [Terriglobia bacterium]
MPLIREGIGWAATAIFAVSYLSRDPGRLRRVQAAAALVWIAYGVAIRSLPVIVTNVIVSARAVYSARRARPPARTRR